MNNYSSVPTLPQDAPADDYYQYVIPALVAIWLNDYTRLTPRNNIIETRSSGFSYLFDVDADRLIAAWGFSQGKNTASRPKARMAASPLGGGPLYHRGHAIAHTLGGATDINLVPQLGAINVGPFRALEKEAVDTPGSLYFTYWIYQSHNPTSQRPVAVEQGLITPGQALDVRWYPN